MSNPTTILDYLYFWISQYHPLYNGLFCQQEYNVLDATWDRTNSKIAITLDREYDKPSEKMQICLTSLPYSFKITDLKMSNYSTHIEVNVGSVRIGNYAKQDRTAFISGIIVKDKDNNEIEEASKRLNNYFKLLPNQNKDDIFLISPTNNQRLLKDASGNTIWNDVVIMINFGRYMGQSIIIDYTNATINYNPFESKTIKGINRLYEVEEYSIDENDKSMLYLDINPLISQSPYYDTIKVINGETKIRAGFNYHIGGNAKIEELLKTNQNFAILSIIGRSDNVPIGSEDETSRTALIRNIKRDYALTCFVKRINERADNPKKENHNFATDSIHKYLDIVDRDFEKTLLNIKFSLDNDNPLLNDAIQDNFEITLDSGGGGWEVINGTSYYTREIIITVIQDGHQLNVIADNIIDSVPAEYIKLYTKTNDDPELTETILK